MSSLWDKYHIDTIYLESNDALSICARCVHCNANPHCDIYQYPHLVTANKHWISRTGWCQPYGGFGFKKEDGLKCMDFEPDVGRKIVIEKTLSSEGWTDKDIIEWYKKQEQNRQTKTKYNCEEIKDVLNTTMKKCNVSLDDIVEVLQKMKGE